MFRITFTDPMPVLAIDLGTSNTVGVVMDRGKYRIVEVDGSHLLPSAVSYNDDGTIKAVGKAALKYYWANDNVVRFVKRIIGYGVDTAEMKQYIDNCGCEVVKGKDGKAAFSIPAFPDRSLTPTIVSSHIIRCMADHAERQCDSKMEGLVVSVPAFFNQEQINETRIAAEMANVCDKKNIKIVSEPVAAALDYGVVSQKDSTIMVIDFGGGTADICIMKINKSTFQVLGKHGDRCLGGDDVTNAFVKLVEKKYLDQYGEPLIQYSSKSSCRRIKEEELKDRVEMAKLQFSDTDHVMIRLDDIHDQYVKKTEDYDEDEDLSEEEEMEEIVIRRSEFNQCIDGLLKRVIQLTRETLEIAGLTKNDIDNVIMVGGSSRLLALQDLVYEEYGEKMVYPNNPDECVAFGACRASSYALKAANIHFIDVVPHFYGCVKCSETSGKDEFLPLIPRNTPFPTDKVFKESLYLVQLKDGTSYPEASLDVYMSIDGTIHTARKVNTLSVTNANRAGGNAVTVQFTLDDSGMIHAMITQRIGENPLVPDTIMCSMQPQAVH